MSTFPASGHNHLRLGRQSIPGQLYLLTTVTSQRQPIFLNMEMARAAARIVANPDIWMSSHCLCWVLMPDHLHALVELGDGANLSTTMKRIKGTTARSLNQLVARRGPLWAQGFHDHALRKDEDVEKVARYIIGNPVRSGLVDDPLDYPYWDAWFLQDEQKHRG